MPEFVFCRQKREGLDTAEVDAQEGIATSLSRWMLQLESVDNGFEQGITVALHLLGMQTMHDRV